LQTKDWDGLSFTRVESSLEKYDWDCIDMSPDDFVNESEVWPLQSTSLSEQNPPTRLEMTFAPESDRDAFTPWREFLAPTVDASRVDERLKPFVGRIGMVRLEEALLLDVQASAHELEANWGHVRRLEVEHLAINVMRKGELRGDYNGASLNTRPGDVFIVEDSRPSRRTYTDFRVLGLYVSRDRAAKILPDARGNGLRIAASSGAGVLLSQHISLLEKSLNSLTAEESRAAIEAALIIASGAVQARLPILEPEHRAAIARTKKHLISQYIDQNIDDPDLSPDLLCAVFGVSRSNLYRMFEVDGGVYRFIFDRRLDRTFELLRRGAPAAARISALALDHGFKSEAHFSRAFRLRFGLSPSDLRAVGRKAERHRVEGSEAYSVEETIIRWFRTCGREP
jgi:AraC-like DNA-binding protein